MDEEMQLEQLTGVTLGYLSETVSQTEVISYLTTPCLQRDVKNDDGVETDGKKQSKKSWVTSKREFPFFPPFWPVFYSVTAEYLSSTEGSFSCR